MEQWLLDETREAALLTRETQGDWVACTSSGIASEGLSPEEALAALEEAVRCRDGYDVIEDDSAAEFLSKALGVSKDEALDPPPANPSKRNDQMFEANDSVFSCDLPKCVLSRNFPGNPPDLGVLRSHLGWVDFRLPVEPLEWVRFEHGLVQGLPKSMHIAISLANCLGICFARLLLAPPITQSCFNDASLLASKPDRSSPVVRGLKNRMRNRAITTDSQGLQALQVKVSEHKHCIHFKHLNPQLQEVVLRIYMFLVKESAEIHRVVANNESDTEQQRHQQADERDERITALEDALDEQRCFNEQLLEVILRMEALSTQQGGNNMRIVEHRRSSKYYSYQPKFKPRREVCALKRFLGPSKC